MPCEGERIAQDAHSVSADRGGSEVVVAGTFAATGFGFLMRPPLLASRAHMGQRSPLGY